MDAPPETGRSQESFSFFLVVLVFVLLSFLLYLPSLFGEFVSDDYVTIVDNPAFRHPLSVKEIWQAFNTRFLTGLTLAWNYSINGLDTWGYHVVNVLFHLMNAVLVVTVVRLLCATPALKERWASEKEFLSPAAGLIFLVHPLQTQAVSFITQRAVLLSVFFSLCVFVLYLKWRLGAGPKVYVGSLFCYLAALFSKENSVTLPILMMAADMILWPTERVSKRTKMGAWVPFFLMALIVPCALSLDASHSVLNLRDQVQGQRFRWDYFLTEIIVLGRYLQFLFFPVGLTHDYDISLWSSWSDPRLTLSSALLFTALAAAVLNWRRDRLWSWVVVWFFVTTSVEVLVVSVVHRGLMYDHWMYWPMVGCSLGLAAGLCRVVISPDVRKFVLAVTVVVFSGLTFQRNFVWQTEIGFWEDNVRKSPDKEGVYLGLGRAYSNKGFVRQEEVAYRKGIRVAEARKREGHGVDFEALSRLWNNWGLIAWDRGDVVQAHQAFAKAVEINPEEAEAWNNWGWLLCLEGRFDEGRQALRRSLEKQGPREHVYRNLALCSGMEGNFREAEAFFDQAQASARDERERSRVREARRLVRSWMAEPKRTADDFLKKK